MQALSSDKQRQFVLEYLVDFNASQAGLAAGCTKGSASTQAWKWLQNAQVQAAMSAVAERKLQRQEITADRVLAEIARVGFSSIGAFTEVTGDGGVLLKLKPDSDLAAVQELTQDEYTDGDREVRRTKVKLHPKLQALEQLAKMLSMVPSGRLNSVEQAVEPENDPEIAGRVASWLRRLAGKMKRAPTELTVEEVCERLEKGGPDGQQ